MSESKKPHFKIFPKSNGDKGIFLIEHVNETPYRIIVDTGANMTIIKQALAQELGKKVIGSLPYTSLHTIIGAKIPIQGKVNVCINFGNAVYHHEADIAEISAQFIIGLDFLRKYDFTLDFKNNEMLSDTEDVILFEIKKPEIM